MASGSKVSYARVVSATTTSAPSPSKTRPNPEAAEVKKPVEETKPAPSVEGQPQKKESADDDGGGEWHTVDTKAAKKQKEEQHPPPRVPKGENSGPRRREGAVSRRFSERPPEKGSSARFPREKHAPDHHASSSTPSAPVPHSNGPHRTPVANGHQNVVAAPDSDSDCGKAAAGDANNLSASSSVSSTNSQPDKPKLVEAPVPKVNPWARKPSSVPTTSQPATRDESPQKVAVAQTTNSSRRPAENSPSTVVRAKQNEVAGKRGDRLDAPPARKERAKTVRSRFSDYTGVHVRCTHESVLLCSNLMTSLLSVSHESRILARIFNLARCHELALVGRQEIVLALKSFRKE
jgi:hypothetical protein